VITDNRPIGPRARLIRAGRDDRRYARVTFSFDFTEQDMEEIYHLTRMSNYYTRKPDEPGETWREWLLGTLYGSLQQAIFSCYNELGYPTMDEAVFEYPKAEE
jgi:hypothetical protein